MKRIDFAKVIGWLGFILRCPICGYKYKFQNIRVIESEQDEVLNEARFLIHSDCEKCKSSVMFNIDISGPEIVSVGTITDLTGKDSAKFSRRLPINVNDLISIHQSLKNFDGDLVRALRQV